MRTLGTIDEHLKLNPDAQLTNRNFLQQGVFVHCIKKHPKGIKATKVTFARAEDRSVVMIYFGSACPYIDDGVFPYSCSAVCEFGGCGYSTVLTQRMADDPNWEIYKS